MAERASSDSATNERRPFGGSLGELAIAPAAGLVGRTEELSCVKELVAAVVAGRGRSAWVDGEPGIGKSALVVTGLADAQRLGCQVFAARADESSAWFPLRVLLDALGVRPGSVDVGRAEIASLLWASGAANSSDRTVMPGDSVPAAAERVLMLVDRLCMAGPVVLVVDDLQWADEMSLAVWARLHRVVRQLPLLLVGASRPVPARVEVDRLRRVVAQGGVRLELGALDGLHVAELVRRHVGAAPGPELRARAEQAGGNPLYVAELVDSLTRDRRVRVVGGVAELLGREMAAPPSLAAAIAERLGFLSKQATEVLQMAALLGVEFSVEHLGLLTTRSATELVEVVREAVTAGVVADVGTKLMFRHALIRHALYAAMPVALRAALHRQAAQALAEAGAPVEHVAEQLMAAPQAADAWVVGWLADAAPILIDRAPQVAADMLERVYQSAEADDICRNCLGVHLATALFRLGRHEQVERVAGQVLARTHDPEVGARIGWTLASALRRTGRCEPALAVTAQALAERGLTAVWTARLRALHGLILCSSGYDDLARSTATQAATEAELAGDRLAVGYALHTLSMVEGRSMHDEAASLETIDRALAVVGQGWEGTDLRLLLLGNRAATLGNLGRPVEADQALGYALAVAERTGTPPRLARLRLQAAEHLFFRGRWDDALAELDAAAELRQDDPPLAVFAYGVRALIAVHRDDRGTVDRCFGHADKLHLAAGEMRYLGEYLLMARALRDERDRMSGQALAKLLEAFDPDSMLRFPSLAHDRCLWVTDVVRLSLSLGNRATAEAATGACMAEARRQPLPDTAAAVARHCRGLLAADPTELMSAAEAFQRIGLPLYRAQALEDAAVLRAESSEPHIARPAYAEALKIYVSLDATWDIMRADARLRPLGLRRGVRGRRGRPATGWDALTPTERKIADLVTSGESTSDIAAAMFLSRATVNTHISHILTKLDAHSRVDIAREVTIRRHGATQPARDELATTIG